MANPPRILAFAGSTREGSWNKKLLRVAVEAARGAGAEVTHLDLRDFPMPLYDGDLEAREGIPPVAAEFRRTMIDHEGLLLCCPEYNSSVTGVWKNAIDWASRPSPGLPELAAFDGKVAGLLSASPGALGGLRGLVHARQILSNVRVLVIPEQFALSKAADAFDERGNLKDAKAQASTERVAKRLWAVLSKLRG
jgi:NAD(P)H-dependent FMN reductase